MTFNYKSYIRFIILLALFALSQISADYALERAKNYKQYKHKNTQNWDYIDMPHIVGMVVGSIILCGNAICVFRLMPNLPTRLLKYIHAAIHGLVLLIIAHAYYLMYIEYTNRIYVRLSATIHRYLGQAYMGLYLAQSLTGFVVFFLAQPNQHWRRSFALFHNYCGLMIYSFGAAVCLYKIFFNNARLNQGDGTTGEYMIYHMYSSLLLVFGIIIGPYFEWRVVGSI